MVTTEGKPSDTLPHTPQYAFLASRVSLVHKTDRQDPEPSSLVSVASDPASNMAVFDASRLSSQSPTLASPSTAPGETEKIDRQPPREIPVHSAALADMLSREPPPRWRTWTGRRRAVDGGTAMNGTGPRGRREGSIVTVMTTVTATTDPGSLGASTLPPAYNVYE